MTIYYENTYPEMTFSQAKSYFEAAFLDYYGQPVDEISEETSKYLNGAWIFNSPLWSSDSKTVTNYGNFRDKKGIDHAPFGAVFITESTVIPIYPG